MRKFPIFIMIFGCFITVFVYGADVIRDYKDSNIVSMSFEHKIEKAECSRVALIVSMCSITISNILKPDHTSITVSNLHLGNMGGEKVFAMRIGRNPERIVVSSSILYLTNRMFALGLFIVLGLVLLAAVLKKRDGEPLHARASRDSVDPVFHPANDLQSKTAYSPSVVRQHDRNTGARTFGRRRTV